MSLNLEILKQALQVTWQGMLGLFIFMGIFLVLIVGLTRLFPNKEEE